VAEVRQEGSELDLSVALGPVVPDLGIGDSLALSGCCSTVTRIVDGVADFRLSAETLRRTWLGRAEPGMPVNIESALRAGDPLGGHMVQGHVDTLAEVVVAVDGQGGGELQVRVPREFLGYCVAKGSVALDGVSLTVAALEADEIMAAIIPHTAQTTTIGTWVVGQSVNLEVDVLAKYVESLLEGRFGKDG